MSDICLADTCTFLPSVCKKLLDKEMDILIESKLALVKIYVRKTLILKYHHFLVELHFYAQHSMAESFYTKKLAFVWFEIAPQLDAELTIF